MKELNDQIQDIIATYADTTHQRENAERKYNVDRVRELRARVAKSRDREEIAAIREELDKLYRNRPRMSVGEKRERAARRRLAKQKRRVYSAEALEQVGLIRHEIMRAKKNDDFVKLRRLEKKLQEIDKDPRHYTEHQPHHSPDQSMHQY